MALRESNKTPTDEQSTMQPKDNEDAVQKPEFVLDSDTKRFLNGLQECWKKKDKGGIQKSLQEYFKSTPNPYLSILKILMNVGKVSAPSLGYTITAEFFQWIDTHKNDYKDCLNVHVKELAFELIAKKNCHEFTKKISAAFDYLADKQHFSTHIQGWIRDKKFKDAGQLVVMLKLQTSYQDPEVLLLPLILQDSVGIAKNIICDNPEMQRALVTYLDNLLAPGRKANAILKEFVRVNGIPSTEAFFKRPLDKIIAHLVKFYDLSPEVWPNLYNRRKSGALYHEVHQHYTGKISSLESFRENARDILGSDTSRVPELVKLLLRYDTHEALYFAQTYNVPKSEWPRALSKYKDLTPEDIDEEIAQVQARKSDKVKHVAYYSYKLPRDSIRIVDDAKSFEDFLTNGLKDVDIVGIDTESKPNHSMNEKPGLSTVQIATKANVFIVDVSSLESGFEHLWLQLNQKLFDNENILKLGFALGGDIDLVRKYLLPDMKSRDKNFVDMSHVFKRLQNEKTFNFPYPGNPACKSMNLSKLVEVSLGCELSKAEQCSDWSRRPLREEQILYAALDAYCLLEVYDVLSEKCSALGLSLQDFCKGASPSEMAKPAKHKKFRRRFKPKSDESKPASS